jgi:hypothetical protein
MLTGKSVLEGRIRKQKQRRNQTEIQYHAVLRFGIALWPSWFKR